MSLYAEPPFVDFFLAGGVSSHSLVSLVDNRLAFKVKTSNNADYRVKPIFGFLEAKEKAVLEIARVGGTDKPDKVVVQWTDAEAGDTDAKTVFTTRQQLGELVLPIRVVPNAQ